MVSIVVFASPDAPGAAPASCGRRRRYTALEATINEGKGQLRSWTLCDGLIPLVHARGPNFVLGQNF